MITTPASIADQHLNCEITQINRVGICLPEFNTRILAEKVKIIEENNYFKENLERYARILVAQKETGLNLAYWVNYTFEVGTDHLMPK